jgi:hypothetical protein
MAQIYRWVDDAGRVTLSDVLPDDPSSVREITVIGDTAGLSLQERRTLEIVNEALKEQHAGSVLPPAPESPDATAEISIEEQPSERPIRWRGATETVQDPCLISPDPRCHEKHAADYHPYYGYAPSIMRAAGAVGATGTIGKEAPAPEHK